MTAAAILTDLQHRGVDLFLDGDRIRWRAPKGVLTPADVETLTANKQEITAALQGAVGLLDDPNEREAIQAVDGDMPPEVSKQLAG